MYHTLYRRLYHRILADRACEVDYRTLRTILGCSARVDAESSRDRQVQQFCELNWFCVPPAPDVLPLATEFVCVHTSVRQVYAASNDLFDDGGTELSPSHGLCGCGHLINAARQAACSSAPNPMDDPIAGSLDRSRKQHHHAADE